MLNLGGQLERFRILGTMELFTLNSTAGYYVKALEYRRYLMTFEFVGHYELKMWLFHARKAYASRFYLLYICA